jgi:hypothetical protein
MPRRMVAPPRVAVTQTQDQTVRSISNKNTTQHNTHIFQFTSIFTKHNCNGYILHCKTRFSIENKCRWWECRRQRRCRCVWRCKCRRRFEPSPALATLYASNRYVVVVVVLSLSLSPSLSSHYSLLFAGNDAMYDRNGLAATAVSR